MIKLRILRHGDDPGLSRWTQCCPTSPFKREVEGWVVAEWVERLPGLACTRTWVQSPALGEREGGRSKRREGTRLQAWKMEEGMHSGLEMEEARTQTVPRASGRPRDHSRTTRRDIGWGFKPPNLRSFVTAAIGD